MQISVQFFIRENCHNSRTSNDVDLKFGPVTKTDKKYTAKLKTFDNDVISKNFDAAIIFPIYGQFDAFWKSDSGCMVTFLLTITFYLSKTESRTK